MKKNGLKILSLFLIIFTFYLLSRSFVLAESYELSVPLGEKGEITKVENLPQYISTIFEFGLGIAGLLALGLIIFGAIQYTTSAGNVARQQDAKDRITSAIYGLVLLLGAFLILNVINPKLTQLELEEIKPIDLKKVNIEFDFINKLRDQIKENTVKEAKKLEDIQKIEANLENAKRNLAKNPNDTYQQLNVKEWEAGLAEQKILRYQLTLKIQEDDIRSDYVQNNPELLKKIEGNDKHGLHERCALFGLILGAIAVVSWIVILFGVVWSILGIVFSVIGLKSSRKKLAQIGLGLSILGLVLSIWYIYAAYSGMINYNYFTSEFWTKSTTE